MRTTNQKATTEQTTTTRCVDAKFLAEKYNVSTRLILRMAAHNQIPHVRIGRCVRFREVDVARVLE